MDWLDIGNIRTEWRKKLLNPAADLENFERAPVLYERDDYGAMMVMAPTDWLWSGDLKWPPSRAARVADANFALRRGTN
jgi:hypothetical protein